MSLASASVAHAQSIPAAPSVEAPASVSGTVATPGVKTDVHIAGVMVTLHRVGSDSSGPVDSVRTDAAGHYAIKYRRSPADEAIYFAAALYRGIAYFSSPIKSLHVSGEEGEITVFDTTTRPIELHVRGHHFVVSAPRPDGARSIVEVWELSNDTTVTLVQRDSTAAVWTTALPRGATEFSGGDGDVSAGSLVARAGNVLLKAPFGPGVKQLSYSYSLPPGAFPLALSIEKPTVVLEVLLEEPDAQVAGTNLRSMPAATTGGRTFKRFLAQDVPPASTLRVSVPVTTQAVRTKVLVVVACAIALIMIGALVRSLGRSMSGPRRIVVPARQTHEDLAAAIALLDARKDRADPTLDDASYASQRAVLKTKLLDALAASARVT
ncbi:MAG: hypothetical protein M3Z05_08125 [Gemmatimonadota bacterium]|nr:hypothetical protein [Gemmatimonadota bacterium]